MPIYNKYTLTNNFLLYNEIPNCLLVCSKDYAYIIHQHVSLDVISMILDSTLSNFFDKDQYIILKDETDEKIYAETMADIYKKLADS